MQTPGTFETSIESVCAPGHGGSSDVLVGYSRDEWSLIAQSFSASSSRRAALADLRQKSCLRARAQAFLLPQQNQGIDFLLRRSVNEHVLR